MFGLGGLEHGAEELVGRCAAQLGGDLAEALHDGIDRFIERGGASGDADVVSVDEPGGIEFFGPFDLNRVQTVGDGSLRKLTRVVAVASADDDDVIAFTDQLSERGLPLLRRMTDRVDETHFRRAVVAFDGFHEPQGGFNRLRGLRDDTEAWMRGNLCNVGFIKHDNRLRKVANESAHFDMLALPDDDWLIAFADERGERVMGLAHQRTGGVDYSVACVLPRSTMHIGRTMRSDDDVMRFGGMDVFEIATLSTDGSEMALDERIMHKLAENGQRGALRVGMRGAQGIAHPETHAVMLSEDDVHDDCSVFSVGLTLSDKVNW